MNARANLGQEDRSQRPWTARPSTRKLGVTKQESFPNFVDELLDCRFMQAKLRRNESFDGFPPPGLCADVGQELRHQVSGGSTIMLRSSKIYVYEADRCLVAQEHFMQMGWGMDTLLDGITKDVIEARHAELEGRIAKRRKGRAPETGIVGKKLIGNAECLPDLASVLLPLVFTMNCGLFARDLEVSEVPYIDAGGDSDHHFSSSSVLDINSSIAELKGLEKEVASDAQNVPMDDDA